MSLLAPKSCCSTPSRPPDVVGAVDGPDEPANDDEQPALPGTADAFSDDDSEGSMDSSCSEEEEGGTTGMAMGSGRNPNDITGSDEGALAVHGGFVLVWIHEALVWFVVQRC